jgi:hypothetical protein
MPGGPGQPHYSLETSTDLVGESHLASLPITNADRTAALQIVIGSEPVRFFRAIAQ